MMTQKHVPSGYELFDCDGSFNDALSPFYMKIDQQGPALGLFVDKQHLNPMGICHGGVYMTLMDFALCAAVCHMVGKYMGVQTISMSTDFLSSAKEGEWIWADVEPLRQTNTMGFAQGVIRNADNEVLFRASASYKLPKDIEQAAGISVSDLLNMKGIG